MENIRFIHVFSAKSTKELTSLIGEAIKVHRANNCFSRVGEISCIMDKDQLGHNITLFYCKVEGIKIPEKPIHSPSISKNRFRKLREQK